MIVDPSQFWLIRGPTRSLLTASTPGWRGTCSAATCGIHPFYTPRSHPDKVDVNARCIESLDLSRLRIMQFDGQNWEAARATLIRLIRA